MDQIIGEQAVAGYRFPCTPLFIHKTKMRAEAMIFVGPGRVQTCPSSAQSNPSFYHSYESQ